MQVSRFTRFFRQQMSAFYPFRGGDRPKRTLSAFFYRFSHRKASLSSLRLTQPRTHLSEFLHHLCKYNWEIYLWTYAEQVKWFENIFLVCWSLCPHWLPLLKTPPSFEVDHETLLLCFHVMFWTKVSFLKNCKTLAWKGKPWENF